MRYESVALFLMVVSEIPNFWSGFLPSLFTIATFSGGDEHKFAHTKRWIRRGEIQAASLSVLVGAATSLLVQEPWPMVGALLMVLYLAYQYENALLQGQRSGLKMDMAGQSDPNY